MHLTGLPLPLSAYTGSNRWQLDSEDRKGCFAVSWPSQLGKLASKLHMMNP